VIERQSENWRHDAACWGVDVEIFFPPRDKELYRTIADEAKSYCFGFDDVPPCPVRLNCLWYAVNGDEVHGIWGGLSHRERNALVRKWRKQFRNKMTLKEYIFSINEGNKNGASKIKS
jgi:WhiB family redox-sensing transcriptional regulator